MTRKAYPLTAVALKAHSICELCELYSISEGIKDIYKIAFDFVDSSVVF